MCDYEESMLLEEENEILLQAAQILDSRFGRQTPTGEKLRKYAKGEMK